MSAPSETSVSRPWVLAVPAGLPLLVSLVGALILAAVYGAARHESLIRDLRANLAFSATLTAQRFDANLRIADIVLESLAEDLAAGSAAAGGNRAAGALIDRAHEISFSDNLYLLDEDWRVLAVAFDRLEPALKLNPKLRSAISPERGSEVLVVDCPAEGGPMLALIRPFRQGGKVRYLAALFSGFDIAGRLAALGGENATSIGLRDRTDAGVRLGGGAISGAASSVASLEATSSFPTYPVRVSVSADLDSALSGWRTERRFLVVVMVLFSATVLALTYYDTVLRRRRRQVASLQRALEADATLFREINHRIKNNLVLVGSVLNLGSGQLDEGTFSARRVLESAKDRIHSIALVHELLYKGRGTKSVNLAGYIDELRAALGRTYDPEGRIEQAVAVDASIELSFDLAVPCGMILSELITNAYKYAFPGWRRGTIALSAARSEGSAVRLVVEDDGVGMPSAATPSPGIGSILVAGLADQLQGSIERDSAYSGGVRWVLRFNTGHK